LIKDFKLIDLLTDIIHYPFSNGAIQFESVQKTPEIHKIMQMSYRLIKHIINEYRPNEFYASQWLNVFMDHSIKTGVENNLFAESTL
jgi:hypothetical protein